LDAQPIDFVEHALQEGFCAGRRYPRALKLPNVPTLARNLGAHVLDFIPDVFKGWHAPTVNEKRTNFKPLGIVGKKFEPQLAVPNRCHA
jgi:hypothetical protein